MGFCCGRCVYIYIIYTLYIIIYTLYIIYIYIYIYIHSRYQKYKGSQTPQSRPSSKFFRPVPVPRHLSVVSLVSNDILRLLSHNYTWTPRRGGLGVPMDNIPKDQRMLDNPKGRRETMNTGVNPLALFEK